MTGEVRWMDKPTTAPMHVRCAPGLGYLTEERSVIMNLTAADNLRLADVSPEKACELFPALEPVLKRTAGLLSGGEQQMLALARALVPRAEGAARRRAVARARALDRHPPAATPSARGATSGASGSCSSNSTSARRSPSPTASTSWTAAPSPCRGRRPRCADDSTRSRRPTSRVSDPHTEHVAFEVSL